MLCRYFILPEAANRVILFFNLRKLLYLITYRAEVVDKVIDEILRGIFERARAVNEQELVKREVQASKSQQQQKLKQAKQDYAKATKEYAKWESLMLDSIEGTCVFTPEQVKGRMDKIHENMTELSASITELERNAVEADARAQEIMMHHERLVTWADMYQDASPEEKKVVASYIIKAVTLTRDYGIQVEFNISEAQYLNGMQLT